MTEKIRWQDCQKLGSELHKQLKDVNLEEDLSPIGVLIMEDLTDYPQSLEKKIDYRDSLIHDFLLKAPQSNLRVISYRLAVLKQYHKIKTGRELFGGSFFAELYQLCDSLRMCEEYLLLEEA